jgi:phosphoribosylformimino-5-aminoimidazole carboxamide ribotide isomerase
VAQRWVEQGAGRLHLVDLDGARSGKPENWQTIAAIARAVEVPIQVGGGLRSRDRVAALFDLGVQFAILGTVALEQPELVAELGQAFPGRIIVGIDARQGLVATRGWLDTSEVAAVDLAQQMQDRGAAAIIYTDIHRDGTLQGPNLEALQTLTAAVSLPIIASGGLGRLSHLLQLLRLEPQGVTGVILGKALYTGELSLREAVRAVGNGRWQDVPPDLDASRWA